MRKFMRCCMLAVVLALTGTAYSAETLSERFDRGFAFGAHAKHYPAKALVGANQGTVLADIDLGVCEARRHGFNSILMLRTNSRLRLGIYSLGDGSSVYCTFTDGDDAHTWRVALPGSVLGRRVRLGFSWDGTSIRCFVDGKVFASSVQLLPLENVTALHVGPWADAWDDTRAWSDTMRLYALETFDEALPPEQVAARAGVALPLLKEGSPMVLTIPPIPEGVPAPALDGRAESLAWKTAASMPQLIMGDHPEISGQIPEHGFWLTYDQENFYLAFKTRFPSGVAICAGIERTEAKDAPIWGTESFEFRFTAQGDVYRFAGNVAGGTAESRDELPVWHAPWTYRTTRTMNIDDTVLWRGEVAMPWSSVGLQGPPKELTFDFGRSWKLPKIGCHSSLHLKGGGYQDPAYFVKGVLAPSPAYALVARTDPADGLYREKFTLASPRAVSVTYELALASLDGKLPPMTALSRAYDLVAGEVTEDEMEISTGVPGYDAVVHTLKTGDAVVMREIVPYKLDEKFFSVTPYLLGGKIVVNVKSVMLRIRHGGGFRAKVALFDGAGRMCGVWPVMRDEFDIPFDTKGPVGAYTLKLLDAQTGETVDARKVDFPGLGAWARQDFHDETVLPPFQPLATQVQPGACDEVVCAFSERTYTWKDSVLLSGVVSKGEEVFCRPAEILIDGQPVDATSFKIGLNRPHRLTFDATVHGAELNGWLEYDGVNWNTLKVRSPGKSLAIRYVLRPECARYIHGARGGTWGQKMTGYVQEGRTDVRYYPVLWICNEERGFCFFTETRSGWNASEKTCYTIEKGADACVVTVHVMDRLPDEFSFDFGFVATPLRPLAADHPFETFGETRGIMLNRPGRVPTSGVVLQMSEEHRLGDVASFFGDQDSDVGRKSARAIRAMYEEWKEHPEARIVPYTCARWLSNRYPEAAAYLNDWKLVPELTLDDGGTGHFMVDMCPSTLASDYFMWRFRGMLQRNPEQCGIYCDFGTISECANAAHGCHGHIPLLAYRAFIRRLAAVQTDFYTNVPIVVLHNTDCNQVPCLAFASHLYNGEQVRQQSSSLLHDKKDILDSYGLDMWACELSTLPLGVWNGPYLPFYPLNKAFGGDEEPSLYKFRMEKAAFAATLLHDHFPNQSSNHYGLYDKVYRLYEAFGVGKTARFVGYWRQPAVVTGATNVYVSCYTDGSKVLAVIGHIGREHEDKDVCVTFDRAVLGLTGELKTAEDTMTRPDPDYQWLVDCARKHHVKPTRCPVELGEFGTRIDGFDGKILRYHLPFHTYGIVELK